MDYVYVAVGAFLAGVVVTWLYKSSVQAKLQSELDQLKASAIKQINKI